jgi:hypothetical protein
MCFLQCTLSRESSDSGVNSASMNAQAKGGIWGLEYSRVTAAVGANKNAATGPSVSFKNVRWPLSFPPSWKFNFERTRQGGLH